MQIFPVVGPNGKHKHATSKLALRDGGREADSQEKRGKAQSLIMRTHAFRKKKKKLKNMVCRSEQICSCVPQMCPNFANMHTVPVPVLALL